VGGPGLNHSTENSNNNKTKPKKDSKRSLLIAEIEEDYR
jgi:hypothetical protein